MLIKQLTAFFLSFVLIFISTPSFAADPNDFRKPNQWQRERTINDAVNKSSVKVEAQRTYPVSTLDQNGKPIKQIRNAKATITLGAKTANVSKSLFKRAPAIAITNAVIAILDKSVSWILDPENNSVKYKASDNKYLYKPSRTDNYVYTTATSAAVAACALFSQLTGDSYTYTKLEKISDYTYHVSCRRGKDGYISTEIVDAELNANDDYNHIPIEEVSQKIIDQAQAGDAPAMQVMNDAALDALEAGLLDAQLDAASDIPQPDPQEITQAQYDNPDYPEPNTPSNPNPNPNPDPDPDPDPNPNPDPETPTDPENPFELPPFCSWASKVCDFVDWMQKDPPEDTQIELPEPDAQDVDTDIDFGGQCPDDAGFTMNIFGNDVEFVMMPFSKFCPLLDTYIKPVLVVLGSFMAVTIVGGRRDG